MKIKIMTATSASTFFVGTAIFVSLFISLFLSLFASFACYAAPIAPATIKPGKIFEKCMSLNFNQKLEYQFDASAKVNFNLHYHKGDSIYYPVKVDRTKSETGVYESQARDEFCLMWENKTSADVVLSYTYRIVK